MSRFSKITLIFFCCVILCLTSTGLAKADTFTYMAELTGGQEVPPNASPGRGFAFGTYDNVTNILTLDVAFKGLLSPTVAAHFHCCTAPGANAPIVIPFTGFPVGVTMGTFADSYDLTSLSATQRDALLNGLWYINIHSNQFPGGEIRAQINLQGQLVPEPGTMLLLGIGLMGVAFKLRRRRRPREE